MGRYAKPKDDPTKTGKKKVAKQIGSGVTKKTKTPVISPTSQVTQQVFGNNKALGFGGVAGITRSRGRARGRGRGRGRGRSRSKGFARFTRNLSLFGGRGSFQGGGRGRGIPTTQSFSHGFFRGSRGSGGPRNQRQTPRSRSPVNRRSIKLPGSRRGNPRSPTRGRGNFQGGGRGRGIPMRTPRSFSPGSFRGSRGGSGPRNNQRKTPRSRSPGNRRIFQLRGSLRGRGIARSLTRGRGNFQGRGGRGWNVGGSGGGSRNYRRQTSQGFPRSRSPGNLRSKSFQPRRSPKGKGPRSNGRSHRRRSPRSGRKRKLPGRSYYGSLSRAQSLSKSLSQSLSQSPSDQSQPQRDNALTPLKKELVGDQDFQTKTLDQAWELLSRKYKVQLAALDDQINKDLADATSTNVKNATGGDGAPAEIIQITTGKQWVDTAASLYYPQNGEPARKAVVLLTSAMNALPPLSSVTNEEKKKLNDAYAMIHYQRARAFFMLNQQANFEQDVLEALRLGSDTNAKMEMIVYLLSSTANRVKKLVKESERYVGRRALTYSAEDNPKLNQARALTLKIQDLMLHYACMTANAAEDLDKLKSFRLRNMYDWAKDNISLAMDEINSSSKTDSSGAKADSSPKNGAKAKAASKPANAGRRLTNVLDNVSVDPFAYKLMTKKDFYKDRVIFYESMLAFLPNRNTPEAVGHCGNCFREAGVGRLHPCSVCTNVQFCTSGCERVANYISTDGKLYGRHKYACQFGPQLYERVGKCAALVYQLLSYTSLPHLMLCEASKYDFEQFLKGTQANPTKNIWQSFAVATLLVRRYKELLGTNDAKKLLANNVGRVILAEAYYLMKVAEAKLRPYGDMNKKNAKKNEKNDKKDKDQKKGKDENKEKTEYQVILFKMVYYLLWFVHHHPQAHDQIGKFVQKQQTNSTRSRTTKKSVKIINHARKFVRCGYGFGAFGGLLQHNCEPNVVRRFNTFTGNIEYVAKTAYLPAKTELTIDWGLRPAAHYPKGSVRRKQTIQRRFGLSCNCPKCPAQYQGVQTLSYNPQRLLTEQAFTRTGGIGGNRRANINFPSASSPSYRGF